MPYLHNQFIKFTLYVLNKLIYPLDTLWIDKDGIHSGKWHGPQIIPASKKRWGWGLRAYGVSWRDEWRAYALNASIYENAIGGVKSNIPVT